MLLKVCYLFTILFKLFYNLGISPAETLLNDMFHGYDKRIRPFAANNTPVMVDMTIVLGILIELVILKLLYIFNVLCVLERK